MKFIKRNIISMIIIIFILSSVGVCASSNNYEIMTGSTTGTWIKIGAATAEKANDFYDGFPFTALPSTGSVGNPPIVSTGQDAVHFGMSYGPFLLSAQKGEAPYDKPLTNLRAVAALTPTVVHFMADVDSEIDSVYQLLTSKTKIKLGAPSKGGGSYYVAQIIFSVVGMDSLEDVKEYGGNMYYGGSTDLVNAWRDRHINANIITFNVPSSAIEEALVGRKGKILNMGDAMMSALKKEKGFEEFLIPAGTYSGQEKDVISAALPLVIFTRDDVPEDVVYNVTKALYENFLLLFTAHSNHLFLTTCQKDWE